MHITTQGLVLREVSYKESRTKSSPSLTAEGGKRTVKGPGLPPEEQPPGCRGPAAGLLRHDPV